MEKIPLDNERSKFTKKCIKRTKSTMQVDIENETLQSCFLLFNV